MASPIPTIEELEALGNRAVALSRAKALARGVVPRRPIALSPAQAAARTEARKTEAVRCREIMAEGERLGMVAVAEVLAFDTREPVDRAKRTLAIVALPASAAPSSNRIEPAPARASRLERLSLGRADADGDRSKEIIARINAYKGEGHVTAREESTNWQRR